MGDRTWDKNMTEIAKMDNHSGSAIKGWIVEMGRQKNPAQVQIHSATKHGAKWKLLSGDPTLPKRVGQALGLLVTDETVEARH